MMKRKVAVVLGVGCALWGLAPSVARAQKEPAPAPPAEEVPPAALDTDTEAEPEAELAEAEDLDTGFLPAVNTAPPLAVRGYVDVGFAKAQGNGTSYPRGDTRLPADYGVDTFAPAVNSRGDVASTDAGDRFVNGFLPRSMDIGGRPSFLLNTVNVDLQYNAATAPVMSFMRVQYLPRIFDDGDRTRVFIEQAFGRITPFKSQEFAITIGKFDSVFGIEYLQNQAPFRTGVTPSLMARYTTGTSLGVKAYYRRQIAPLWSAFSINMAATNSGNFVESLQVADKSLTGVPVGSVRLGYELNHPLVGLKLGTSGLYGPRNDQRDPKALQMMWGADARLIVRGFSLAGEYVHVDKGRGDEEGKVTGLGSFPLTSAFHARGYYVEAAYGQEMSFGPLRKVTLYGRYGWRHAWFEGFIPIKVDRMTAGVRVDLWDSLIVKAEYLLNRELEGAPQVDNDVFTSSVVFTW